MKKNLTILLICVTQLCHAQYTGGSGTGNAVGTVLALSLVTTSISSGGTECILNTPQIIVPGGKITVMPGKTLRIIGSLIIQ